METSPLQIIYQQLCLQNYVSREQAQAALLQLAEAFVRGAFTPDLQGLTGAALRRGAYLMDVFLRLYMRDRREQQYLRIQLEQVSKELAASPFSPLCPFYLDDTPGRDQVAHTWGLSNGIRPASIPGLLDLQRRAFINGVK